MMRDLRQVGCRGCLRIRASFRLAPAISESASNKPREIHGYLVKRINYFAIET